MKPTDKAIVRMVSESPGRNGSEPVVASTKNKPRRPSSLMSSEGNMARRRLAEATRHSGGVVRDSTVTKDMLSNWRSRPRPMEKSVEQRSRITGATGKSTAGETVTARPVVAMKWGNTHGAKGPCCTSTSEPKRKAGVK
jgi:hypothetical protein